MAAGLEKGDNFSPLREVGAVNQIFANIVKAWNGEMPPNPGMAAASNTLAKSFDAGNPFSINENA